MKHEHTDTPATAMWYIRKTYIDQRMLLNTWTELHFGIPLCFFCELPCYMSVTKNMQHSIPKLKEPFNSTSFKARFLSLRRSQNSWMSQSIKKKGIFIKPANRRLYKLEVTRFCVFLDIIISVFDVLEVVCALCKSFCSSPSQGQGKLSTSGFAAFSGF
jgi:hypothetical protein